MYVLDTDFQLTRRRTVEDIIGVKNVCNDSAIRQ